MWTIVKDASTFTGTETNNQSVVSTGPVKGSQGAHPAGRPTGLSSETNWSTTNTTSLWEHHTASYERKRKRKRCPNKNGFYESIQS